MNNPSAAQEKQEPKVSVIWKKLQKIEELAAGAIGKAEEIGTVLRGPSPGAKLAGEEISKGAGFLEDVIHKENDILDRLEELSGLLCSIKNGM